MNHTNRLTVVTLGRFQVWRAAGGGSGINAWGREKARTLCQYLVTRRHALTPKERIGFDLWPELDGERADRDFKVALNALLAALEPNRPPRAESQFIQRRGPAYGLVLERWDVDADRFTAHIDHAARVETSDPPAAMRAYRAAVALYRGDYLPDALYEDWASAERERLLALYLSSTSRLAALVLAGGQDQEAINLAQAVIARDPCCEEVYRVLMRAHVRRGNRPQAIRAYEHLVRHLDEELDLVPMPETRRLYDQVRAGAAV